jgi:hypothetical protein
VRAGSGVSRGPVKAPSSTTKRATTPAAVTESVAEETIDFESGPAAEDLAGVEVEEILGQTEQAKQPTDGGVEGVVWDEEESQALRQARRDAELTASTDSVRAYLKQIGKIALLNAEQEVALAKRIEAGLYAAETGPQRRGRGRGVLFAAAPGSVVDRPRRRARQKPLAGGQPAVGRVDGQALHPAAACPSSI